MQMTASTWKKETRRPVAVVRQQAHRPRVMLLPSFCLTHAMISQARLLSERHSPSSSFSTTLPAPPPPASLLLPVSPVWQDTLRTGQKPAGKAAREGRSIYPDVLPVKETLSDDTRYRRLRELLQQCTVSLAQFFFFNIKCLAGPALLAFSMWLHWLTVIDPARRHMSGLSLLRLLFMPK